LFNILIQKTPQTIYQVNLTSFKYPIL